MTCLRAVRAHVLGVLASPMNLAYSTTPVSRTLFKLDFSLSRTKTLSPVDFLTFLSQNGPLKSDTV